MGSVQTKLGGTFQFQINDYEFRLEGSLGGGVSSSRSKNERDGGSTIGGRSPTKPNVRDDWSRRSVSMQQQRASQKSFSVIEDTRDLSRSSSLSTSEVFGASSVSGEMGKKVAPLCNCDYCDNSEKSSVTARSVVALKSCKDTSVCLCPLCHQFYRRPIKVLPCGHSFCYRCLYKMRVPPPIPIVFKCAICDRTATVDDYRHGLPTNVALESVLIEMGIDEYDTPSMHYKHLDPLAQYDDEYEKNNPTNNPIEWNTPYIEMESCEGETAYCAGEELSETDSFLVVSSDRFNTPDGNESMNQASGRNDSGRGIAAKSWGHPKPVRGEQGDRDNSRRYLELSKCRPPIAHRH